jgi:hypothetical protein
MMDALYRSWKNMSQVASIGVVAEALDENARAFYIHHEFRSLKDVGESSDIQDVLGFGQWAIFFPVVLTDGAAKRGLRNVATKVVWERIPFPSTTFPRNGCISVSQFQKRVGAGDIAGTCVGLADDLLENARHLAAKGVAARCALRMRRAISTAY